MKGVNVQTSSFSDFKKLSEKFHSQGSRLEMAYAWYPYKNDKLEVIYFASLDSTQPLSMWRFSLEDKNELPSLSETSPLMSWYEREMYDLFGIGFGGHPELNPLAIHDGAVKSIPVMHPDYPPEKIIDFSQTFWAPHKNSNNQLQLLPYGPVRADVCESAQFIYLYAGESILHFYERLFFKHRGMEKRFEGLSPELGVILSERVSGVSSVAHALAFSQAVEAACDCDVPQRAKEIRVLLTELERLYNHLAYLGQLCHTTTLKVGEAEGRIFEEKLKQINAKLTGSRFLRELITPGGLRRDLNVTDMKNLYIQLSALEADISLYCHNLQVTDSHIDRLMTTGILPKNIAFEYGATGPIARASDLSIDLRVQYPYAAYELHAFEIPTKEAGDAYSRMDIRILEIEQSFKIIKTIISTLSEGSIRSNLPAMINTEGLGWAESPRGALFYAVHFDSEGKLARVKIRSPSFSNWYAFPYTVNGTNMMDYAINEASFGLTIAGCDR